MFQYLARRHDRKFIEKSLQRQKRIADKAIEFEYDGSLEFTDISEGEEFFAPILPCEPIKVAKRSVTFRSDITTADEENNTFECVVTDSGSKDHALVVFHHWYARSRYPAISRFFAARGITVVEATLPYHFGRGADDHSEEKLFNANLNQTVDSIRQAVLDGRKVVRWLHSLGYRKISVVGMCLGGTVAGLIAAHEEKVDKAVLLVTPGSPADLVWTAETMAALRGRIEAAISLDDLRTALGLINLEKHVWSLTRPGLDLMFVLGRNDTIARPATSDGVIDWLTRCDRPPEVLRLGCGHSSLGLFPYNFIAARRVLRFLTEAPTLAELWGVRRFRYDFGEV